MNIFELFSRFFRDSSAVQSRKLLIDRKALDFFNALSGNLRVDLTEPAQRVADLLNVAAPPDARVVSLRLDASVFDKASKELRPLTDAELGKFVFKGPLIRLRGESGEIVSHESPDGAHFSVSDLLHAIEETERKTRDATEWLGGVDVHHCFFEGIHEADDGVWEIYWGS